MQFKGLVSKFPKGLWSYNIIVTDEVRGAFKKQNIKRFICTIDNHPPFHAAFMAQNKGEFFIKLNEEKMKKFGLQLGQEVYVKLVEDNSKYGMELPIEFEEVLLSDVEGAQFFEKLTPGKQRSLIYMVAKVKSSDIKITKALTILDHLKANNGVLDFKLLNEAMKLKNRKF